MAISLVKHAFEGFPPILLEARYSGTRHVANALCSAVTLYHDMNPSPVPWILLHSSLKFKVGFRVVYLNCAFVFETRILQ